MELVDTHCHIQSAAAPGGERSTRDKWAKVPERTPDLIVGDAFGAGVTRMICVGCDLEDSRLAIEFVNNRPECFAAIGIHPHEAHHYVHEAAKLGDFAALATAAKVVAIGECGLDYYYGHSPEADQAEILRFQMKLAQDNDLPMIFHVRGASSAEPRKDAFRDFWPIFDSISTPEKPIRGVLHSFTDTEVNLDAAMERGLYIGVNGIATFAKAAEQVEMYKKVPLSRLLLETDAPFLTPSPYRGTICEPYHIKVIAEFLSDLRQVPIEELARATTENAKKLLQIS